MIMVPESDDNRRDNRTLIVPIIVYSDRPYYCFGLGGPFQHFLNYNMWRCEHNVRQGNASVLSPFFLLAHTISRPLALFQVVCSDGSWITLTRKDGNLNPVLEIRHIHNIRRRYGL